MEIAYVGPVPPSPGGIAQHGARLAEALRSLGHRVHVHAWSAQYPSRLYKGPADTRATPHPGATFDLRWWDPSSWWRTGRAARQGDLLVFPWVTPAVAPAYRVILAAAAPVPAVAIVHNLAPHESRAGDAALTRWILRRTRGALLHSAAESRRLEEWGVKTRVVAHPSNLALEPAPLPTHPPYRLLFFGHIRPYKGLDIALEAIRLLTDRGVPVQLTVAGHVWGSTDELVGRIARAGLDDVVTLQAGYVPDEDVGGLFAAHHIVVAPYRSATQSGIVPLAKAAARPIVATRVGGLVESVTEGVDGTLAEPEPHAFAAALERAIDGLSEPSADPSQATWTEVAEGVLGLGAADVR